jgi:hypothetical protein
LFFNFDKAGRDLRYLYLCKNKFFFSLSLCLSLHYFFTKEKETFAPTPIQWIHLRTYPWIWNHQDFQDYRILQDLVSVLPLREALQILWETLTGLLSCHKL